MYIAEVTRSISDFLRCGSSGSSGSGSGSGALSFSPVHSRKPPHDPQNASVSLL
jgi:hypothetical protein